MPKGSRRDVTKNAPYGKGRKSRKKRYTTHHPATFASKRTTSLKDASTAGFTPRIQQIVPQFYLVHDLKRIGIITGAMLLLLIVLYLVL